MGYLIDPPQRVEGDYVAVFAQTDMADALAIEFLKSNGLHPVALPQMGDLGMALGGAFGGGADLYGGEALLCVPVAEADQALDLLEFDSGLVDDDVDEDDGA
ncbi:MAG TPA: hypothetical protein VKF82_07520 [Candidatus Eremiobacteraceae bacterium]|nr:hypothetical protein [Candidatus Eremiobacteraceae bacterium]